LESDILPFKPIIRDFIRNLWYLRFIVLLIATVLLVSSGILAFAEGPYLDPQATFFGLWGRAIGVTLEGFSFSASRAYSPVTVIGKIVEILNSFISYIVLGIFIWVVEQSLTGHKLKKSKYLLFPRE